MSIVEELRAKTSRDNRDLLDRAANEIEWLRQDLEGACERIDELIHKYDLAVAEREANVKGFTEELTKARSEVARGIFEEIESLLAIYTYEDECGWYISTGVTDEFAEIKKKYLEETQNEN